MENNVLLSQNTVTNFLELNLRNRLGRTRNLTSTPLSLITCRDQLTFFHQTRNKTCLLNWSTEFQSWSWFQGNMPSQNATLTKNVDGCLGCYDSLLGAQKRNAPPNANAKRQTLTPESLNVGLGSTEKWKTMSCFHGILSRMFWNANAKR